MRVKSFLENFKMESKFTKCKKNSENSSRFRNNCIWKSCYEMSLLRREYLFSVVNSLTNGPKVLRISLFQPELPSQGSINTLKVLSFSIEQSFGPLTMSLAEGSSEMGLFRNLFSDVSRNQ